MGMLFLACLIQTTVVDPVKNLDDMLPNMLTAVQTSLLTAVIDTYFYGNWLFAMVTLTLLPAWTLFWSLMWTHPY